MKGIVGNNGNLTIEILQSCLWGLCNTVKRETAEELNKAVPGNFSFIGDVEYVNCNGTVSHICAGIFKVTQCLERADVPYNISRSWSNAVRDVVAERCHSVIKEELAIFGSAFGVAAIILLAFCCCFSGVCACAHWMLNRSQNESQGGENSQLLAEDGTPARSAAARVGDKPAEKHETHGPLFSVDIT